MEFVDGRLLPVLARDALLEHFELSRGAIDVPYELHAPRACFVTLTRGGRLRGCVGSTRAEDSLARSVRKAAVGAATRDPRFEAVDAEELPDLAIEVSVLSDLEPVPVTDLTRLESTLEPGVDGVVIECGDRSATFLPQVWRQLPDARRFLKALLDKAGVAEPAWNAAVRAGRSRCWRYEVSTWREY